MSGMIDKMRSVSGPSHGFAFTLMRASLIVIVFFTGVKAIEAQEQSLSVRVVDSFGQRVAASSAFIIGTNAEISQCGRSETGFVCLQSGVGSGLRITATGFSIFERGLTAADLENGELTVVLSPAGVREQVVVSPTRSEVRLGDTPVSVAVVGRASLDSTSAPTLDDALRQVPGFSIFRRSSSRNANPTTQGVSLRGVGASGASRSLVLLDGVPLNDPFGGWVQWGRVAPISLDQVEVVRGGASSLYGSGALSGTVALIGRRVSKPFAASGEFSGGTQGSIFASGFAGSKYRNWFGELTGGRVRTSGYVPVDPAARGPVDSEAGVRSLHLSGRLGRSFGDAGEVFARPLYFSESRTNGTPLQTNRTHSRGLVVGGRLAKAANAGGVPPDLTFDWRVYGGTQVYDQAFSAVSSDRTAENLTRLQRSPSQHLGLSLQAVGSVGGHTVLGGLDMREVRGSSDEIVYAGNLPASLIGSGGEESSVAAFVQDNLALGKKVIIGGGLRYDRWENRRGLTATRSLSTGAAAATVFPDRVEDVWSPKLTFLFTVADGVSFHFSGSKSFRAPTLNELYRGFRVGSVVTMANADLRAERATNFEAGASYGRNGLYLRGTAFRTDIEKAIANVTIAAVPGLITRQRQNAGKTTASGFEADSELRLDRLAIGLGYLFVDPVVGSFPSDPGLVGRRVPQVPRHQFTFQTRYSLKKWTVAVQGRAAGEQFDDDLNELRLEPYFQMDIFAGRLFEGGFSFFVAVENAFNSRYSVGRTPIRTVSSPFSLRIGLRWN